MGLPNRDGQHDHPSGNPPIVAVEAVHDLQQLAPRQSGVVGNPTLGISAVETNRLPEHA
jgi:hypothetical protein